MVLIDSGYAVSFVSSEQGRGCSIARPAFWETQLKRPP
jgi:hypothetical protein